MNILVFGAGAVGSFFGGILSKTENVILIGRKDHVNEINKNGLKISGKTNLETRIKSFKSINEISKDFDLVILSVKSYDTNDACKEIAKIISKNTIVLSLQNGLDNIQKIEKYVDKKNIIAGVTTNGVLFEKPGFIVHTGVGYTKIGELDNKKTKRVERVINIFNESGINASFNSNIKREIWIKGIVNSSINPVTAFFNCKNGYIKKNPILKKLVENICKESTNIANSCGFVFNESEILKKTMSVIADTSDNYSSMLQSIKKNKPLEIDSINGELINIGKKNRVDTILNEMLVYSLTKI